MTTLGVTSTVLMVSPTVLNILHGTNYLRTIEHPPKYLQRRSLVNDPSEKLISFYISDDLKQPMAIVLRDAISCTHF